MLMALASGLGLFLLGMMLLTDGLKALAGAALRKILTHLVAGPASGLAWGAVLTALVQSSTATSLATVGFVSAGLLTFPQAVAVIFGANIGTTSTGWIVSQLGFKVSLGALAPPIVLLGVLLRLLGRGKLTHIGSSLAGFGLLFIGIDLLGHAMGDVATHLDPASLPGGTEAGSIGARLLLVVIGVVMTTLTQSSSASMAATLAAVLAGAVSPQQAAALIVGQNIGTTPTAMFAAIGAPAAAKRTVLAHVLFNLLTGLVALAVLPVMFGGVVAFARAIGATDAPTHLALFHTAFNLLGVAMLFPAIGPFSRLIERIIPERRTGPTRFLSAAVAAAGPVGTEAARRALILILADLATIARRTLAAGSLGTRSREDLAHAEQAVSQVTRFVHQIATHEVDDNDIRRLAELMHAADHLDRLASDIRGHDDITPASVSATPDMPDALREIDSRLRAILDDIAQHAEEGVREGFAARDDSDKAAALAAFSAQIARVRTDERAATLRAAAAGRMDPAEAAARIDTLLWLDGLVYHLWRAVHHLASAAAETRTQPLQPAGETSSQ